jgi:hypothetical protein
MSMSTKRRHLVDAEIVIGTTIVDHLHLEG